MSFRLLWTVLWPNLTIMTSLLFGMSFFMVAIYSIFGINTLRAIAKVIRNYFETT